MRQFRSATALLLMIAPWKPSACCSNTARFSRSTSTRRSRTPLRPGQLLCTRHAGAVVVLRFKDFSFDAGADPFAKTCGGFLPIHNMCCRRAPAYTDTTIVLWMIDRMISHHGNVEAVCTRLIDASPKEFRARNGYDNDLLLQHLATKLGTAAPLIRDQVPVISDRGPVVTYVDLDDPVRGDALFQ